MDIQLELEYAKVYDRIWEKHGVDNDEVNVMIMHYDFKVDKEYASVVEEGKKDHVRRQVYNL